MKAHSLFRSRLVAGALALLQLGLLAVLAGPALADPPKPSISLFPSAEQVALPRIEGTVSLDLGVFAAAVDGPFRLEVSRAGWDQPIKAVQVDDRGVVVRRVPDRLLNGFHGLRNFFTITFRDAQGAEVAKITRDFCPTGYERQRLDDSGPTLSSFTDLECGFAFTKGIAWGIDRGWALNATPPVWRNPAMGVELPDGDYEVTIAINRLHAVFFDVPAEGRAVTVDARVEEFSFPEEPPHGEQPARMQSEEGGEPLPVRPAADVPDHLVPDLEALPAWNLSTYSEDGRDYLSFASTPWNSGPGAFVVEGFRRKGAKVMDAYQYLVDRDGKSHGRVPIGQMDYHEGGGHDHWHFLQFARFDLLSQSGREVVRSQKQGFCLAATHPIDLLIKGAVARPWESALSSNCGGPNAMWVREVLPSGWGDTYQNVSGQAFDITGVRNGTYVVRVQVDPEDRLYQARSDNDEALRTVTLGGAPGARTVEVAPWNGIDG